MSDDSRGKEMGKERALFSDQRMQTQELHSCASPLQGQRDYRHRTRIIKDRDKLIKGRDVHILSENRWKSSINLDATSFYSFHDQTFLIMAAGRCLYP